MLFGVCGTRLDGNNGKPEINEPREASWECLTAALRGRHANVRHETHSGVGLHPLLRRSIHQVSGVVCTQQPYTSCSLSMPRLLSPPPARAIRVVPHPAKLTLHPDWSCASSRSALVTAAFRECHEVGVQANMGELCEAAPGYSCRGVLRIPVAWEASFTFV